MKRILILLVVLLTQVSGRSPIWKVFCSGGPVFRGRVDPIVNPGKVSGHSHKVSGGNHFSAATTTSTPLDVFNELYSSSCTTCSINIVDMSAYWHPDLYYRWPNGTFSLVPNGGLTVYYLSRAGSGAQANPDWQPIPKGLRMLAGNPYRRNFSGSVEDQAVSYVCLTEAGAPNPGETNGFNTANAFCKNGLRGQIFFPMCWDGVHLDSPDHKSHMAYPSNYNGGNCPPTHPVRIPGIFMEAFYAVDKFPHGTGTNPFVWSCGDPTGYGFHADFLSGWDEDVMRAALADPACDNNNPDMAFGNNVKACPPLAPYVQTVPGEGECSLEDPIPLTEDLGIAHPIPALPGCNPLTYGPEPAVPCSLDPLDYPKKDVSQRFLLKSKLTGKYVTAPNIADNFLVANETKKTLNEVFAKIPYNNSHVGIMNENFGNYLSANGDNSRLRANRGSISGWELFSFENRGTNTIAIISARNGKYVSVGADFTLAPTAATVTGDAELFIVEVPDGGFIGNYTLNTNPRTTPTTPSVNPSNPTQIINPSNPTQTNNEEYTDSGSKGMISYFLLAVLLIATRLQ